MLLSVHHTEITVPKDQEMEARAFYYNVLGLHEIEKPAVLKVNGGFWLQLGGLQIHIGREEGVDRHKTKSHIAYLVDNLDAWRKKLYLSGIEISEGTSIPGFIRMQFRDPFGNRIEFLQNV